MIKKLLLFISSILIAILILLVNKHFAINSVDKINVIYLLNAFYPIIPIKSAQLIYVHLPYLLLYLSFFIIFIVVFFIIKMKRGKFKNRDLFTWMMLIFINEAVVYYPFEEVGVGLIENFLLLLNKNVDYIMIIVTIWVVKNTLVNSKPLVVKIFLKMKDFFTKIKIAILKRCEKRN